MRGEYAQIVDAVNVIRMGVSQEHGVHGRYPGRQQLKPKFRGCIHQQSAIAILQQKAMPAPTVALVVRRAHLA